MAFVWGKHKFEECIIQEMINPKYETRPYISGGMFLFFGGIHTEYREDLVSFDGYKDVKTGRCSICGQPEDSEIHETIIRADII